MKKTILILIVAAVYSISYGQGITLDFLQDTFCYNFNQSKTELIENNPEKTIITQSENKVHYNSQYITKFGYTFSPAVVFEFKNDSLKQIFILFDKHFDSFGYEHFYKELTEMFGPYTNLEIKNTENIQPENAYHQLLNNEYSFTQEHPFNNGLFTIMGFYIDGKVFIGVTIESLLL